MAWLNSANSRKSAADLCKPRRSGRIRAADLGPAQTARDGPGHRVVRDARGLRCGGMRGDTEARGCDGCGSCQSRVTPNLVIKVIRPRAVCRALRAVATDVGLGRMTRPVRASETCVRSHGGWHCAPLSSRPTCPRCHSQDIRRRPIHLVIDLELRAGRHNSCQKEQ